MKKAIIAIYFILCLCGCGNSGRRTMSDKDSLLAEMNDSVQPNSSVFRTSDTASSSNPELLKLLDALYQHVKSYDFPAPAKEEELWMSQYRKRLSDYYDSHQMGSDSISEFAKMDSVLNEGTRLIELDDDWSTMGMLMKNSTKATFEVLRGYGLLTLVLRHCSSVEELELFYHEWDLYNALSARVLTIAAHLVYLRHWGGSIIVPLCSQRQLGLSQTRSDMYLNLLWIAADKPWDDMGVFLEHAQQLFLDSASRAVSEIASETVADIDEEDLPSYNALVQKTQKDIERLRPLLEEWIAQWKVIDSQMTHDNSRHAMERTASNMLMQWASIVSSFR